VGRAPVGQRVQFSSRPQNYDRGSGDEYGRSSRDDYGRQQGRPPKKRRSFLEELFD